MDYIVTGRIFENNRLRGYKVWCINNNSICDYQIFALSDIQRMKIKFKNCKYTGKSLTSLIDIPIVDYPRYNTNLKLQTGIRTDSDIIAHTYRVNIAAVRIEICGALITGAILDPYSKKAENHAELYYEEIRHRTDDIIKIAKNLNKSTEEIRKVKNYLFMEQHQLDKGYARFDANFHIAQSWQRLCSKDSKIIQKHDRTLIEHEIMELNLVKSGLSQREAHMYAESEYNYRKESDEYYDNIKKYKNNK